MNLELEILPGTFAVCQLPSLEGVDLQNPFLFLARTDEELSLVCPAERVPAETIACESGWRALRVRGPLDFALVGIMARLAGTLADAGISLFAVSTFNTDYLLVRETALAAARAALTAAGCSIRD